jgi:hypothetical protein
MFEHFSSLVSNLINDDDFAGFICFHLLQICQQWETQTLRKAMLNVRILDVVKVKMANLVPNLLFGIECILW